MATSHSGDPQPPAAAATPPSDGAREHDPSDRTDTDTNTDALSASPATDTAAGTETTGSADGDEPDAGAEVDVGADTAATGEEPHEFLVPGPDQYSNTGTLRWGLTWVLFSVLLILFMLVMSFVCWLLASWTGLG